MKNVFWLLPCLALALSGAEGARRLCAVLRGDRVHPLRQELPIELMARGSSARASQSS